MKISKFEINVIVFIFLSFQCPISLSGPMPGMSINSGIYWRDERCFKLDFNGGQQIYDGHQEGPSRWSLTVLTINKYITQNRIIDFENYILYFSSRYKI